MEGAPTRFRAEACQQPPCCPAKTRANPLLEAAGRRTEAPEGAFVCLHTAAIEQPRHFWVAVAGFADRAFQLVALGRFVPPVLARHGGLLPYCSGGDLIPFSYAGVKRTVNRTLTSVNTW